VYKVEVSHRKDLVFQAKAGGAQLLIDAKGSGFTPLDALLAGLGSCIGVYIRKYAAGAKLAVENFKLSVEAELSQEPPLRFRQINVYLDLGGAQLEERRLGPLLEFIKNCPVHNTLKGNPEVSIKVWNSPSHKHAKNL